MNCEDNSDPTDSAEAILIWFSLRSSALSALAFEFRFIEDGANMELTAKGQRILTTAGAGGIGRAMTETFVKAGAKVHICDVVQSALEETARALSGVTATLCDVADLKQVDQLFSDVESYL